MQLHSGLDTAARVALARGAAVAAAQLLGAAAAQEKRAGSGRAAWSDPVAEQTGGDTAAPHTAVVRTALGDPAFTAAFAEGYALSTEAAIDLALQQTTATARSE
jgi:hypothetical protein